MLQGIAEFFSACGEVKAVRLAGRLGSKKAWVEFGTKESARSAKEYDNTVRHQMRLCLIHTHCTADMFYMSGCACKCLISAAIKFDYSWHHMSDQVDVASSYV